MWRGDVRGGGGSEACFAAGVVKRVLVDPLRTFYGLTMDQLRLSTPSFNSVLRPPVDLPQARLEDERGDDFFEPTGPKPRREGGRVTTSSSK